MAANCKSFLRFLWYYPVLILALIVFYSFGVGMTDEPVILAIASCSMLLFVSMTCFLTTITNQFQMTIQFSSTRKAAFGGLLAVQLLWSVGMPALVLLVLWLLRGEQAVTPFWTVAPVFVPLVMAATGGGGLLGFATMLLRKAGRVISYVIFFATLLACFALLMPAMVFAVDQGFVPPAWVPVVICGAAAACFAGEGIVASRYCVKG